MCVLRRGASLLVSFINFRVAFVYGLFQRKTSEVEQKSKAMLRMMLMSLDVEEVGAKMKHYRLKDVEH